ncbi:sigma-54 interaction domain-containing protein [Beggiatoa leptomitoformis]|uniref:PAS domain-containing protein n=1 Tax=Beggiatoa leptomitoformis TaxID=288004 RepID=A0A2N9YAM1_9GAMM|nr:sigma 54-interacting transcriptional regulator [Beggiatoa leptomitoformis]ALG67113.1 PAS domain-containing protein [Beggiatoa leptomitoformis]AUI67492.1 PAS domain-containing protein [Beggiatoa leptomitoformis]
MSNPRLKQLQHDSILLAAGEGIFGLDSIGNATFINPAALKMIGWSLEEIIGKPIHDMHHHSHADGSPYSREECPIYMAIRDGLIHHGDNEVFWRKNGTCFPVDYTSTPVYDGDKVIGAVVVFQDITERRCAELRLHQTLAEVQHLKEQLQAENHYLREEINTEHNFEEIIGHSAPLQKVLRQVSQVAPTDASVLIQGESGTGKELIARAIHNRSQRKDKPLIKVNCAAIAHSLVDSELFGHEKGAFTGALHQRIGRFELADGGTLFLDEIAELPLETQVKLLRVLQEQEFERVGSSHTLKVDVRIIAATNRDVTQLIHAGTFRQDLFYRLTVFPLYIPPLRERRDDIPLLIRYFLGKAAKKFGKNSCAINQEALTTLQQAYWHGNIRELQNALERAVIVAQSTLLTVDDFLLHPAPPVVENPAEIITLAEAERRHILHALTVTHGTIAGEKGAAALLDIHPNTLRSRMIKLGIHRAVG